MRWLVQMLERLDLTDEADRAASDTSLGQQQRMATGPRRGHRTRS